VFAGAAGIVALYVLVKDLGYLSVEGVGTTLSLVDFVFAVRYEDCYEPLVNRKDGFFGAIVNMDTERLEGILKMMEKRRRARPELGN
jgi:hypothetical protein